MALFSVPDRQMWRSDVSCARQKWRGVELATATVLACFIVSLVFGLGAVGTILVEPVAAQADNATNATETDDGREIVQHDFERAVDSQVLIESWRYDTGTEEFTINIRVRNRSRLSITEALSLEAEGDAEINVFSGHLRPGRHQINFSASPGASDEAAAILSTPRSFRQGNAVIISTGYIPDDLPFSRTDPTVGWLGGAFVLAIMVVLAGLQRIRGARKEPEELR